MKVVSETAEKEILSYLKKMGKKVSRMEPEQQYEVAKRKRGTPLEYTFDYEFIKLVHHFEWMMLEEQEDEWGEAWGFLCQMATMADWRHQDHYARAKQGWIGKIPPIG